MTRIQFKPPAPTPRFGKTVMTVSGISKDWAFTVADIASGDHHPKEFDATVRVEYLDRGAAVFQRGQERMMERPETISRFVITGRDEAKAAGIIQEIADSDANRVTKSTI